MFSVPPPPKGKECKNNKVPYVWIKQREKGWTGSFEALSKQGCSTILYRKNEQIKNERLCDGVSSVLEHDEKNLVFVAFWQADTTNTIYVVGYNYVVLS